MSRGGYLGGSSVVGFNGSFTGERRNRLDRVIDVDAHLNKKSQSNTTNSKRPKKLSKEERAAENLARRNYREADRTVVVEERTGGQIVSRRTIERS